MKYLKKFENHSGYTEFVSGGNMLRPNVSHCIEENDVHYNPKGWKYEYFTIESLEDENTISFNYKNYKNKKTIQISQDNGKTWSYITPNSTIATLNTGDKIIIKGNNTRYYANSTDFNYFKSTKNFKVCGNAMSLIFGDDFLNEDIYEGVNWNIGGILSGNTTLLSAKDLVLPVKDLSPTNYAYCSLFTSCNNLVDAPELPALKVGYHSYDSMFAGCESLATAPELPATTLGYECYYWMFKGCTSLTAAPELPATTLAQGCYRYMFYGCTSLTTAPELPATTLASTCYDSMFQNCTSLTTAPELLATTLVSYCYSYMFNGCTNLNYIKAMFTTTPSTTYTQNWVSGVTSTGTFVKNAAATWDVSGVNGIPTNWTVQTATA